MNLDSRLKKNPSATNIFVSKHLPKALYQQKKKLLPLYQVAKSKKESYSSWCIQNGEYCFYIEDKKTEMESRASAEKFPGGRPIEKRSKIALLSLFWGEGGNGKKTEKMQKKTEKQQY